MTRPSHTHFKKHHYHFKTINNEIFKNALNAGKVAVNQSDVVTTTASQSELETLGGNRAVNAKDEELTKSKPAPVNVNDTWLSAQSLPMKQQRQNALTEDSVLLCHSTNLRLNYSTDQTGAPRGVVLSLSNCAVASSIFRKESSKFLHVHPGGNTMTA